jgi:hypothetical protein
LKIIRNAINFTTWHWNSKMKHSAPGPQFVQTLKIMTILQPNQYTRSLIVKTQCRGKYLKFIFKQISNSCESQRQVLSLYNIVNFIEGCIILEIWDFCFRINLITHHPLTTPGSQFTQHCKFYWGMHHFGNLGFLLS